MIGRLAAGLVALGLAALAVGGCAYRSDIDLPQWPIVRPAP